MEHTLSNMILIIEDDASSRKALSEHLRHEGFVVEVAENGVDGLAVALAKRPELVILDMRLPGLSGSDLLHTLRSAGGIQPYVIVLTNDDSMTTLGSVVEEGVTDYLIKADVTFQRITKLVREHVHPRGNQRAL